MCNAVAFHKTLSEKYMKNKKLQLLLTVLLINACINHELFAQTIDNRIKNIEATYPVIDELFSSYAKQNHFPGMVYGLIVDGKLVHTGNIGYTNVPEEIAADSTSEFRVASMTKSFAAMAILKLRDEGKIKLDDPAYLYIPEMKGQHYLTTDAAPITVRHLLMHGAGFPEDNPWGDRQLAITEKEFIEFIKKGISFSNNPGQQYEYSNLGFALLGYIIKNVSGLSYQTYITKNILQPLGMTHTYWEYSKVPASKLAHGYRWLNGKWIEQPLLHDGVYGAMGGMITSIEDLSKYVAFQLSAWPPRNDEDKGLVKRSSLREMQFPWNMRGLDAHYKFLGGRACPLVNAYAYGLRWIKDCDGKVFVGHTGGLPGFGSNWNMMPEYNIGVMCFSNLTYASTTAINMHVLDTIVAIAKLKPRPVVVSAILKQRKNELVQLLPEWKNLKDTHIFADNFFMDYFPDSLRKEATTIFKNVGKIIHVQDMVAENNLRGSFIMEGENSDIEISFTLTPENPPLIQEYHIKERKK
jgi:CubicO group peptidase (beta-lactamase class C family)